MVALGDIRKCLVALAEDSARRSPSGAASTRANWPGHALGNLIFTGLIDATGDLVAGVREAAQLLGAEGEVLPATSERVVLKAEAAWGTVAGQVAVMGTGDIGTVSLVPADRASRRRSPRAHPRGGPDRHRARLVFTSVLAAVAVTASPRRWRPPTAQVVYVCNLRPEVPETAGYDVAAHVEALTRHDVAVDLVLCDSIQGMRIGMTDAAVHDVPLAGENGLVHSPARLAQALSGLLA